MKIIAHRGDTTKVPGNTLEAFHHALQKRVHGIEFDVRLTADHIPVVYHNMMLNTDTETGFVEDYTYDEIKSLQMTVDDTSYHIPSLADVLDAFCGKMYLEIHVQNYNREAVQAIGQLLLPYAKHWKQVEITSYEPAILLAFQDLCAGITCDFLYRPEDWMTGEMAIRLMIEKATLAKANGVHIFAEQATPQVVEHFHAAGLTVHCGVVNTLKMYQRVQSAGIEIFSTDDIHLFIDES